MTGYPFISELFANVLSKSNAIQGRFHVCPRGGAEINFDMLGEVLQDLVRPVTGKKYPLDMMMPPVGMGRYTGKNGEWERYRFTHVFLKTTFYDSTNKTSTANAATRTSTHTIGQDWHDMKRCAVNFLRVLDRLQRTKHLINDKFRLDDSDRIITPVSNIGVDRASGVRLDFTASVFIGCELEDYDADDIADITIPVADSHPEHTL